jgi:hypothetical protein
LAWGVLALFLAVVLAPAADNAVQQAQRRLITLGYQLGTPDGVHGARTVVALKKFQADHGLASTGALDAKTLEALNGAAAPQDKKGVAPAVPASVRVVEPLVFVPATSDSSAMSETLDAMKEADERFKDYALSDSRAEIPLSDVSITVINKMPVFTEPRTSSSPGSFSFGGTDRDLTQDERNGVTEAIRRSTAAYLDKRFRVTKGARFEVVIIVSGGAHPNQVRIMNGFDPYGIETFRTMFIDTQSKALVWCTAREAYGKTLDAATQVVVNDVPKRLDTLFGITN